MGTHSASERSSAPEDRGSEMPQADYLDAHGHFCADRFGPEERLVLTVSQAAVLLGISRAFAYELVARGELPVIRLGRRRLVPRRALVALVEDTCGSAADLEE